ncbi:hypothetical protein B0H11DRAFT_1899468 [Mycena galericulata]|nr:hypothetical protein B0H11DRAFT_1899468 [Mycena galericulata]
MQSRFMCVLIHNAAASVGPFKLTEDGLESQIATDHVGPFLLTKLLAPKLLASASETYTPRVVFVSSEAHAYGTGVDLEMMEVPNAEKYDSSNLYFQAKSTNILTALELSRRSGGKINAYSLHPGLIFTNMNQKEESLDALQAVGFLGPDKLPNTEKYQWKTIPQGAATVHTECAALPRQSPEVVEYNREDYRRDVYLLKSWSLRIQTQ